MASTWVGHSLIISDLGFILELKKKKRFTTALWSSPKLDFLNELGSSEIPTTQLFTYQTHDLIVVIRKETFFRQRLRANKQAMRGETERQREKRGNSSVVLLPDEILCSLSVISFSSAKMDRISRLSRSFSLGWLLHWSPRRHLLPPSLTSLAFTGCYLLKLYELVRNLFFSSLHPFSYFLISQPEHRFNTCLKTPLSDSVHQSVCSSLLFTSLFVSLHGKAKSGTNISPFVHMFKKTSFKKIKSEAFSHSWMKSSCGWNGLTTPRCPHPTLYL